MSRRVVITGMGAVSPMGWGVEEHKQALLSLKSKIKPITLFDASALPVQIAGEVDKTNLEDKLNPLDAKDLRRYDQFVIFGEWSAIKAIEDSGFDLNNEALLKRTGVVMSSGIGPLQFIEKNSLLLQADGYKKISPFFIPGGLTNTLSGKISMRYGFRGLNFAYVSACATGTHSIGEAFLMIKHGRNDIMIAGGAETAISPLGISGFIACKALTEKFNHDPSHASRPFDAQRSGFVMGEGAASLVLEEYNHAKQRGAKIYGEIIGYGASSDAYHITAPEPQGRGAKDCVEYALAEAKISADAVDYVNAHGTSTPMGDEIELGVINGIFNNHSNVYVSSTKGYHGHLLGGAGALETVLTLVAMNSGFIPPNLNLFDLQIPTHAKIPANQVIEKSFDCFLKNSFGFGGTNASLIITRCL